MENISIEVILLGILISFIGLDLLIKGRKKKKNNQQSSIKNLDNFKENYNSKNPSSLIKFLNERPRNIGLYFLSIIICKILINASIFKYSRYKRKFKERTDFLFPGEIELDFADYIKYVFEINHQSFIYSFLVISFISWQLSPYLNKR